MLRFLVFVICGCALAQVKRIPPPGIVISEADRADLTAALTKLKPRFDSSLDLQIRWKAVDWALRYNEFFKPEDVAKARQILDEAFGQAGLIVHGFQSEIDDSVQPYGLVIPPSYSPNAKGKWRLDVWLHGRATRPQSSPSSMTA